MVTIKKGMTISTVQKKFNTAFPFLKLEFFKHPHKVYAGNSRKDQVAVSKIQNDQLKSKQDTDLVISGNLTVAAVEQLFMEYFGLSVQVFRKSGKLWLETTLTDDWTLKKQNEEGLELSNYKP